MKLRTIILLSLLWTNFQLKAQWTSNYKTGINAGYEWNIFLNPSIIEGEEETLFRDDLWLNASYQGAFIQANFKKITGHGRWKLGGYVSGAKYNSEINANRHAFRLNASYRLKYADRKYFEFAPEINRVKRAGVNDQDAILTTPFSYLKLTAPVKLDFYLRNKVWLKTTGGYLYKKYDDTNSRSLKYHAGFIGSSLSKKWNKKGRETKLTYSNNLEVRFYNIGQLRVTVPGEPIDPDESDPGFGGVSTRTWTYLSNDLEYAVQPANSRLKFTIGLYTTLRLDSEEENSYRELTPGITGQWRLKNWKFSGSVSYVNRNYAEREVGEEELPLQYKYIRLKLRAERSLGEKTKFYVQSNLVNRTSSNDLLTRGFREYFNSGFEAGLTLSF